MKRSTFFGAVAVFLVSVAYFAAFRSFGFQVEDEGTLLFQLDRVLHRQRPYLDFHTGYTPGFFHAGAMLLAASGSEVVRLRLSIAAVNAFTAAAMYALVRPAVGPWLSVVAPLAWVTFIPVFPGDFASFNIPYPAWFAAATCMGCALVMYGFAANGGYARVLLAGLLAAAAFAFKINAGAFLLAGCTFVICMFGRTDSRLDAVARIIGAAFMATGILAAFLDHPTVVDLAIHVAPALILAGVAGFAPRGRLARPESPRISTALLALAAGFITPTTIWVVPLLRAMGIDAFLREVLLIGSGAALIYHEDHPPPELYAVVVTLGAMVTGMVTRQVALGRLRPEAALTGLGAMGAVVLGVPIFMSGLMPEGFVVSVGYQLENTAFWLAPLVNVFGLYVVCVKPRRQDPDAIALAVIAPLAVTMYLQLYPRTDFMHVVMAIPMTACLANVLLRRVVEGWLGARWDNPRAGRILVASTLSVVAAFAVIVRLCPFVSRAGAECESAEITTTRLAVCVEAEVADDLTDFQRSIEYLAARTEPDEPVLTFPALTGVLFGARLSSPVPHDYWFPGRPNREQEIAMETGLRHAPPRFAVALNSSWNFFIDAPAYFENTHAFVRDEYRLVARFGRYDVFAHGRDGTSLGLDRQPEGTLEAAIVPGLAARRQGMRRLLAGLTPETATALELPTDTVRAILALRGVRDAGDLRLAGLAIQGYAHPESRVRREALGAMYLVGASTRAALARWAGDIAPTDFRPYVEPWLKEIHALTTSPDPRARDFARLALEIHGAA